MSISTAQARARCRPKFCVFPILLACRARFLSHVYLVRASVGFSGHFEVQTVVVRDRYRASDTFYPCGDAWRSFFVAGAVGIW